MSMTLEENAYASQAAESYVVEPENYNEGVVLYDPLYAEYWNWLWNYVTQNLIYFNEDIDTLSEYISELETLDDTLKSNIATSSSAGRIIISDTPETLSITSTSSGALYVVDLDSLSSQYLSLFEDYTSSLSIYENCLSVYENCNSLYETATVEYDANLNCYNDCDNQYPTIEENINTMQTLITGIKSYLGS